MSMLKKIVEIRLEELGLGAVEAATAAGIERTFIRDIVEDKKKSVRSDKIANLARALKLDAAALAQNQMVRIDDAGTAEVPSTAVEPKVKAESDRISQLAEVFADLVKASPEVQGRALKLLRKTVYGAGSKSREINTKQSS